MQTCGDVMTKDPVCCLPDDSVARVAQIMALEDVGSLPVVADRASRELVGIVTDRDLAVKVVGEGLDNQQTRVEDIMTRNPWVCRAGDWLQKALDLMADQQVRRIPVVDDHNKVVGIIAQADVATRTENAHQTAEIVEQISQPVFDPRGS